MDYLYTTTTKYTFEEFKKYNHALMIKTTITLLVMLEIMLFASGILLQNEFVIIFAIIYPFIFWIISNKKIKKVYDSNTLIKYAEVIFDFYEDFLLERHGSGEQKVTYDQIYRIIETKTNFYLMIAKNQGFILKKVNMQDGLEEFLRSKKKK